MALAILEPEAFESGGVRLKIDTGTNRYYRLKIGKSVEQKYGLDWVDEVFFSTPIRTNEHGGSLLDSSTDVVIPVQQLKNENSYAYVQLFSFKDANGKGPTLSKVRKLPSGLGQANLDLAPSLSVAKSMNTATPFRNPRVAIPCETYANRYAQAASIEDLLSGILKVAGPIVLNLLNGNQKDGQQKDGQQKTPSGGNSDGKGVGDILGFLLKTLLGGLQGGNGQVVSQSQSWNGNSSGNRFMGTKSPEFSRPFIFGIDDALLGAVIGQFVQILPQLANAAVQQRIQLRQANNKLTTDVLSEANRRMLLEQLLQAQRQPQPGAQPVDPAALAQLVQLLQQAPAASGSPAPPPADAAKSLSLDAGPPAQMSRAVISFGAANALPWNGTQKFLFTKSAGIQMQVRLTVGDAGPKTPLSKAIFRFVFKDETDESVRFEKTFKQKNILPNNDLSFAFSQADLAGLPVNRNLSVLAEMRWPSSDRSTEYKALGSTEIVLVNKYFLKEQGAAVAPERELTDMKQFRPFWNKVWESPSLDAAANPDGDNKKYLWEVDVNAKYSVLLSAEHPSNGLMETKMLRAGTEADDLSAKTAGRMKAGIELSIAELNKLIPLWDGQSLLDLDRLEALRTEVVAQNAAGEFIYPLKMKGKASERGMVWIIPVFRLFEFTLSSVQKADDTGQIVSTSDEKARFPLPVAARILGMKSAQ